MQDDPERATHLYGAAERLLEAAGGVPFYDYSLDRSGHERAVEGVRSRMEKAAFEEAWDEGRAMGCGRAVAYALRREA
jgi:hypothetical protein